MAQQTINVGAAPNDGTGTPLRTAFQYTNSNFSELYTAVGPSGNNIVVPGSATITGDLTVDTSTLFVNSTSNAVCVGTLTSQNVSAGRGNLTIGGTSSAILNLSINGGDTGYIIHDGTNITFNNRTNGYVEFFANGLAQHRIAPLGVFSWYDGAGGTRMTLNSNGLGIGVTPSAWTYFKAVELPGGAFASVAGQTELVSNVYYNGAFRFKAAGLGASLFDQFDGAFRWYNSTSGAANDPVTAFSSAKMTLDVSGTLLVGKSAASLANVGLRVDNTGETFLSLNSNSNTTQTHFVYSIPDAAYKFYVGLAGTVFATNTTISAISDARLKENVQDIDVGLGAILALKPRKFDWKAGKGKDIKGDRGFIAQEFEQVFPQLVDEWKDAAPEGEAPYKSVRQDLIPVLVKAIQELTARVQTLETR